MDHFEYRKGQLFCEDVRVADICSAFGTPIFIYSETTLLDHANALKKAFAQLDPMICFSVKSLPNIGVLRRLRDMGCGMDVVSGGEYFRAKRAGVPASNVVFAGVGKSIAEIEYAINEGVHSINVESEDELERVSQISEKQKKIVSVAVRINPDVFDPKTPNKTATGGRGAKFGIPVHNAASLFNKYSGHQFVRMEGVHMHIGSPISSATVYVNAIDVLENLILEIESASGKIKNIDIGGGFPAVYEKSNGGDSLVTIAQAVCSRLERLNDGQRRFIIEPGRSISANAGILISAVEYTKQGWDKRIVVVDGGMNLLIRPSLYGAVHQILPVNLPEANAHWAEISLEGHNIEDGVDVVGPICESGDFLGLGRKFPPVSSGDLIAIFSCGAYGMTMASQYNSRPRAAEVIVRGCDFNLIRNRENYLDLIRHELDTGESAKTSPAEDSRTN